MGFDYIENDQHNRIVPDPEVQYFAHSERGSLPDVLDLVANTERMAVEQYRDGGSGGNGRDEGFLDPCIIRRG